MRKMIVFTEGQTEQLLAKALLIYMAASMSLRIELVKVFGGRKFPATEMKIAEVGAEASEAEIYILLFDCGSDERVASVIKERYARLIEEGYEKIVAVRDVRPDFTYEEVEKLADGIRKVLPAHPLKPAICLATMEVESWFLAEHSHFLRLSATLDKVQIRALGVDLDAEIERIPNPAEELNKIYEHGGFDYDKSKAHVERTIQLLDMGAVISDLPGRTPSITPMLAEFQEFLSSRSDRDIESVIDS